MGMFDSVFVECPVCITEIEFQSKAGDKALNRYSEDNIPHIIACDLEGRVEECGRCGTKIKASFLRSPKLIFNKYEE